MRDLEVREERDGDEPPEGLEGDGGEGDDEEANVPSDTEPVGWGRERLAEGGLVARSHVGNLKGAEQAGGERRPRGGVEPGGEREPGEESGVRDPVEDGIEEGAGRRGAQRGACDLAIDAVDDRGDLREDTAPDEHRRPFVPGRERASSDAREHEGEKSGGVR
jgi:hypothetical protein